MSKNKALVVIELYEGEITTTKRDNETQTINYRTEQGQNVARATFHNITSPAQRSTRQL